MYQKEVLREFLSVDKLPSYNFSQLSKNYFIREKNDDNWNDSILSKPSDILCRNSMLDDSLNVEILNLSNEDIPKIFRKEQKGRFSNDENNYINSNVSKSYIIPISVMEKNLKFDETLSEDVFNEDIKTKMCSTRRRYPGDDNYESQNDLL